MQNDLMVNTNFFERLMYYSDLQGYKNPNKLASALGYSSAEKLYRLERVPNAKPSFEIITDISNLFEQLNLGWLVTGKGEMTLSLDKNQSFTPIPNDNKIGDNSNVIAHSPTELNGILAKSGKNVSPTTSQNVSPTVSPTMNLGLPHVVTVDSSGRDNIAMVPIRASAGYLNGYGDPEYIQKLPSYNIPGLRNGTFRAFEVGGHSMNPTLKNHDIAIGEWVESIDYIRDDRIYIIVTHTKGIVIKRTLNRISKYGFLVAKSDNITNKSEYPNLQIYPDDIKELWYCRLYISSDLSAPSEIFQRLNDLEASFEFLKNELSKKSD